MSNALYAEIERLKSEVERLTRERDGFKAALDAEAELHRVRLTAALSRERKAREALRVISDGPHDYVCPARPTCTGMEANPIGGCNCAVGIARAALSTPAPEAKGCAECERLRVMIADLRLGAEAIIAAKQSFDATDDRMEECDAVVDMEAAALAMVRLIDGSAAAPPAPPARETLPTVAEMAGIAPDAMRACDVCRVEIRTAALDDAVKAMCEEWRTADLASDAPVLEAMIAAIEARKVGQ